MRTLQLGAAILMGVAIVFAVEAPQASTTSGQSLDKTTGKNVTLVGCVGADSTQEGQFTLSETKQGTTYKLSGTDMREYSGRQVQVVGAVGSKRIHVVGGLLPSPNAAAQAGAIDPAQSAREAATATAAGGGGGALPEFRVKRVRALSGSCP